MAVSIMKPPNGGFRSETAVARPFQFNGYIFITDVPNGRMCPFGCNGDATAVVVGQSQRLCSGVRMLTGNYLGFL